MAASRNASAVPAGPRRVSFARIQEPLEVPDLLALQTESFDWLLGNEKWKARVEAARQAGRKDVPTQSGLEEIFEEISPIEDFSGTMSLSFRDHRFEPPKYSVDECKDKDMTFSAPMFVTAEFINNTTGEIKSQTVFMGDFPLMTARAPSSSTAPSVSWSPSSSGPRASTSTAVSTRRSDKDLYRLQGHPVAGRLARVRDRQARQRRCPHRPQAQAGRHRAAQGARLDQRPILERFGQYESMRATLEKDHTAGQDDALLDIYRKLRPGEPPTKESAQTLLENLYFNPKRYDLAKVGRYKINKKLGVDLAITQGTLTEDDIVADDRVHRPAARRRRRRCRRGRSRSSVEIDDIDHFGNRRLRTRRRADPEPGPPGPGPHGARRPRADDDPGRRGDHAADPDQHPPGRRRRSRSSSAPPSCPSSWTRPTRSPA